MPHTGSRGEICSVQAPEELYASHWLQGLQGNQISHSCSEGLRSWSHIDSGECGTTIPRRLLRFGIFVSPPQNPFAMYARLVGKTNHCYSEI